MCNDLIRHVNPGWMFEHLRVDREGKVMLRALCKSTTPLGGGGIVPCGHPWEGLTSDTDKAYRLGQILGEHTRVTVLTDC